MPESPAAARSRLYSLLSRALAFPTDVFFDSLAAGAFIGELDGALAALPFPLEATRPSPPEEESYAAFQAAYIGSFEVGTAGPPCPLYAGVYLGGRSRVWEELLRFYNFFGLHLSPENRDLPDHLATELEFMHYLAWREVEAEGKDGERASLRRAQGDFLERQLSSWLDLLAKRAEKKGVPPFYRGLLELTRDFVRRDLSWLRNTGQTALVSGRTRADG
jgi:DMSO reductase family type II enzyme chaperone